MKKKGSMVVIGDKTYTCVNLIPILDFLKIVDEYLGAIDISGKGQQDLPKEIRTWVPEPNARNFDAWYKKYKDYCIYTNALSDHCDVEDLEDKCMYIPLIMLSWDDILMYKNVIREKLWELYHKYKDKHPKQTDFTGIFKNLKDSLNDIYIKIDEDKEFIIKK